MSHRAFAAAALIQLGIFVHPGAPAGQEQAEPPATPTLQQDLSRILHDIQQKRPGDVEAALEALDPYVVRLVKDDPNAVLKAIRRWAKIVMSKTSGTDLHRSRRRAIEMSAVATLRNLCSAQAQLQAIAAIDVDDDGVGEYGTFGELSGSQPLRGGTEPLRPPVLSSAFGDVRDRRVTRLGYHFQIFLPDAEGCGVAERTAGGARIAVRTTSAADHLERTWCAYAWPVEGSPDGQLAFFVNQDGEVLVCKNRHANGGRGYVGEQGPPADAAFAPGGEAGMITGKPAIRGPGRDGGKWEMVR